MGLIDFLKNKKKKLLEASTKEKSTEKQVDLSKIKIVVENFHPLTSNELEGIKESAKEGYEKGIFDSVEEGIIFCSTSFHGLRYKGTEKDEKGNIIIKLKDIDISKDEFVK